MAKKHILILTAPVGGGHIATAKVLREYLEAGYGDDFRITVCDVFKDLDLAIPMDKIAVPAYSGSVKLLNSYPYKLFFDFGNASPKFVVDFFTAIFKDKATKYLEIQNPDVIVSTFPIISYGVHRVLSKWHRQVPVISLVTDAGAIHRLWLMSPEDIILVSTPDTIDYAVSQGVPRERLHYLGFPVPRAFSQMPSRQKARANLGLADLPTVYLSGGGLGLSNKLPKLASILAREKLGAQYLFVAGKNKRLESALQKIEFKDKAKVYGYVENVPELLAAADLVVGKAGWLSLNETMTAKRPTIIIDVIPGQEEPNAEFVERHGVGRLIKDPEKAAAAIKEYIENPQTLINFEKKFKELNLDPNAGEKIARFIAEFPEA